MMQKIGSLATLTFYGARCAVGLGEINVWVVMVISRLM